MGCALNFRSDHRSYPLCTDTIHEKIFTAKRAKRVFLKAEALFFCTRISRNTRKKDGFLKFFSVKTSEICGIRGVRVQKDILIGFSLTGGLRPPYLLAKRRTQTVLEQ